MKKIEYDILPEDVTPVGSDDGEGGGALKEDMPAPMGIIPERDRFEEFRSALNDIDRVRFRVKPDTRSDYMGAMLFMLITVLAGGILLRVSSSTVGDIIISVLMAVICVIAIALMISFTVKSRKVFYCYFVRNERIFCLSAIGDEATVLIGDTAYRIKGEEFYTLDASGYATWLDGMGTGLFALLCADRKDVEYNEEDGSYFVANSKLGGHAVYIEEGKVVRIVSEQPMNTDVIDPKTGEAKLKTKVYEKTDPTEMFALEIPGFVKDAFDKMGIDLPDIV